MITLRQIIFIIAAVLFIISMFAYLYIRNRMKKKVDLDQIYYEFEEELPSVKKYDKWLTITFASACISALLLFLAYVI